MIISMVCALGRNFKEAPSSCWVSDQVREAEASFLFSKAFLPQGDGKNQKVLPSQPQALGIAALHPGGFPCHPMGSQGGQTEPTGPPYQATSPLSHPSTHLSTHLQVPMFPFRLLPGPLPQSRLCPERPFTPPFMSQIKKEPRPN